MKLIPNPLQYYTNIHLSVIDSENDSSVDNSKIVNANFNKGFKSNDFLNKKREAGKKTQNDKNEQMIKNANKTLAQGKGMFRKRKEKSGNAKLMNKIKFQKKDKIRKNMVKEFTEKPLVYTGEATGIRRDLSRSKKLK